MASIRYWKGDLTTVSCDAIVNAANSTLLGGGGVDGAIHRAGGPAILEECRAIVAARGGCRPGEAVITAGGRLPAKWVVHTVGPVYQDGHHGEDALLARAYRRSLEVAAERGARTVAFPNISTGVYRFPKPRAARIAVETVRDALPALPVIDAVLFVCFDTENLGLYRALVGEDAAAPTPPFPRGSPPKMDRN